MKVVLLQDVAKIGVRYDVVEVPDGFALNHLIPQKKAEPATKVNLKRATAIKEKTAQSEAETDASFNETCQKLNETTLSLKMPASEKGGLFKAVNATIVEKMLGERGMHVSKDEIVLSSPIKTIGEHRLFIKRKDMEASFTLNIESE